MPLSIQLLIIFLLGSLYVTGYSQGYFNFPTYAVLNIGLLAWTYELTLDYKDSQRKARFNIPTIANRYLPNSSIINLIYLLYRQRQAGMGILNDVRLSIPLSSTRAVPLNIGHFFQVRLGFSQFYITSDPEVIQRLYSSHDPGHLSKNKLFYDRIFIGAMNDGLVASDHHIWQPHRKIASRAFTYKSLQSYLSVMNKYSQQFVNDMGVKCDKFGKVEGEEIDERKYFYLMRMISNIVMGSDICTDEENSDLCKNFKIYKEIVVWRTMNPLTMVVPPVWWFHRKRRKLYKSMEKLADIIGKCRTQFRKKLADDKAKGVEWIDPEDDEVGLKPFRCLLEELLHAGMTDKGIMDEVFTFLIAGHETTAVSVGTFFWHMALNPEYQKKCREEVDSVFDAKGCENDADIELNMDDISNLKLLERCLYENLRLTPTVPLFVRRLDTPLKIGYGPDDLVLEAGSNLFITPWNVHRNEKYYSDPDTFNPDNFLPERVKERHPHSFIPFSGGARNCIGWKLSLQESKTLAAWTLRNFEVFTTDKFEDIRFHFEVSIVPHKNIHLIFKRRENK